MRNGVYLSQAEDGIRDAQESRGLGDVYKRQPANFNGFGVLAALLHNILVVGVSQTLRR